MDDMTKQQMVDFQFDLLDGLARLEAEAGHEFEYKRMAVIVEYEHDGKPTAAVSMRCSNLGSELDLLVKAAQLRVANALLLAQQGKGMNDLGGLTDFMLDGEGDA